jgi:ribonuclease HI
VKTNNIAEYSGAISIIELCIQNDIDSIDIYGDSNLVIKQITNQWKVKSDSIRPYYQKMKQLLDSRTWKHIGFHHVKRKFNKRADALANEALDESNY